MPPQAVIPRQLRRTAQRLLDSQTAVFPRRDRSQETIELMIPGRAAAALPASLARILPRLWSCFLIHSLAPPFPGGCGGCGGAAAPPPGIARTIVGIIIPRAVRTDTIVIPCSRKRVFIRSARVLSSCRIRCRVSRIRLIWDRRASLVAEAASRRAALTSCSLRRLSAMLSLVASSVASSSLRFSKAMSLSSSESLVILFVCFPRDLSRARHIPSISRGVYPSLTKTAKSFSATLAASSAAYPESSSGAVSKVEAASLICCSPLLISAFEAGDNFCFLTPGFQSDKPRPSRTTFTPPCLATWSRLLGFPVLVFTMLTWVLPFRQAFQASGKYGYHGDDEAQIILYPVPGMARSLGHRSSCLPLTRGFFASDSALRHLRPF